LTNNRTNQDTEEQYLALYGILGEDIRKVINKFVQDNRNLVHADPAGAQGTICSVLISHLLHWMSVFPKNEALAIIDDIIAGMAETVEFDRVEGSL